MKIFPVFIFYFKKNWSILLLLVIGVVIVGLMTQWGQDKVPAVFTNFWDTLFGLLGVLLTLGLTVFYVYNEWAEQLDRVLIVHFKDSTGRYVASCYNVNILPNAELRGLGQQLGAQILERGRDLVFNPSVKLIKTDIHKIKTGEGKSKWIQYYEIQFRLLEDIFKDKPTPFYRVWNMGEEDDIKRMVSVATKTFHEENKYGMTLVDLLNSDEESMEKFKNIQNII